MADKRHPIKRLGKWKHEEALCGVAGSARVPLIGSVVINVQMTEMGKQTGPEILIRFKVCKAGSTDWVGWILGARALDCQARGGLGFLPIEHGHSFGALGIVTERTENQRNHASTIAIQYGFRRRWTTRLRGVERSRRG